MVGCGCVAYQEGLTERVCRRGVPAARPTGLGVVVAGTVPGWAAGVSWVGVALVLGVVFPAAAGPWWLGVLAAALAVVVVLIVLVQVVQLVGEAIAARLDKRAPRRPK